MFKISTIILDENTIEQISKTLGEYLSGSQITEFLSKIGINENSPNTKWRRLNFCFQMKQNQDKCANNILHFIELVVKPVRFVNDKDRFYELVTNLNDILIFSGLKINEQGKFTLVKKVTTLSEAQERASKLRKVLYDRHIHTDVLKFCKPELLQENYFHAVFEATKSISDKLRNLSGLPLDGNKLVYTVFDKNKPLIAINSLRTPSEKDEQNGFKNLLVGIFSMFRNTLAHEAKIYWPISEQDAVDLLTTLSFIHRKLDNAVKIPY